MSFGDGLLIALNTRPPQILHDTDPYMHGEFFLNRAGVSHVIANPDDLRLVGDVATVCGIGEVTGFSNVADYPICPECNPDPETEGTES